MAAPDPRQVFRGLGARYDLLAELLSFGQNRRWRRAMVDRIVPFEPTVVLDVATGTAGVAMQLAERTDGFVVGLDLSEPMLRVGQRNVAEADERDKVGLVLARAEALPFRGDAFDALTFTYLLRYVADPAATLAELGRVIEPGSPIASLDFFVPPGRFWRACWWLYTRLVLPAAGSLAGRAWYGVGRFLGPNISGHYEQHPLPSIVDAWSAAGFERVGVRLMSLGGGLVMWGRRSAG